MQRKGRLISFLDNFLLFFEHGGEIGTQISAHNRATFDGVVELEEAISVFDFPVSFEVRGVELVFPPLGIIFVL